MRSAHLKKYANATIRKDDILRFLSNQRGKGGLRAAFTLLEILVAIAVVGLLAAIALPVYRFFVPNAATVVNLADLKVINQGLEIYKFQNPTSPLLTGSNDTTQHTALLTAIQGMAESPFKYLAFDPTKISSTGSGQAFRFTGYISGSAAMVTGSGGSGSGSGSGTLTASQVVLNGLGFTTLTGGGSNALASMVTVGLPSGSRVVVGVAGQQSVYELADTTGPQTVPTLVMPNDYGAGNQRMWLQRFWGGTLQTTNYLSEYFGNPGAQSAIQTNLGLGNMSQQNSGNVSINGGTIVLPAGGFTLGSQIVSTVSSLQLSGKIGAGLLSSTTFTLDGSTIGAGFTLVGARSYSLISTSAAAPLGAGYLVLADATSGAYRMAIDSTGRVAFGGTAPYAPTAWLTFRGDGVSPIMDAQLANGTSAFSIAADGSLHAGILAGSAGVLQVDASGNISVGTGGTVTGGFVTSDLALGETATQTFTLLANDPWMLYNVAQAPSVTLTAGKWLVFGNVQFRRSSFLGYGVSYVSLCDQNGTAIGPTLHGPYLNGATVALTPLGVIDVSSSATIRIGIKSPEAVSCTLNRGYIAAAKINSAQLSTANAQDYVLKAGDTMTGRLTVAGGVTAKSNGTDPVLDAQKSDGSSAFKIAADGTASFGVLAGTAGSLKVDATGKVSVGAGGDTSGEWVLISQKTASNSTSIDFTGLTSEYSEYEIQGFDIDCSSSTQLALRTSTNGGAMYDASSFYSFGAAYSSPGGSYATQMVTDTATELFLTTSAYPGRGVNISVRMLNLSVPGKGIFFWHSACYSDPAYPGMYSMDGSGKCGLNADVDAVRLFFRGGATIVTGTFKLFGRTVAGPPSNIAAQYVRKDGDSMTGPLFAPDATFNNLTLPTVGLGYLKTDATGKVGVTMPRLLQQEFLSSGTFTPSAGLLAAGGWIDVTVVGGGGGGGCGGVVSYVTNTAGGGGGGAVIKKRIQISGPVTVTIGTGGAGSTYTGTPGSNGNASSFGAFITALGGGGGGACMKDGADGGCGGGGGGLAAAGGGGGAGSHGQPGRALSGYEINGTFGGTGSVGGSGGYGLGDQMSSYSISGLNRGGDGGVGIDGLGGGGGGGGNSRGGSGLSGGGSSKASGGDPGTPNTGGGGGAGRNSAGGNGGSGYCVVRWVE